MIANLARRDGEGGGIVLERIDSDMFFEGGDAQIGALATFELDGQLVTGRVIGVSSPAPQGFPAAEPVVDIELIDVAAHDAELERTLANLPPENDNAPKL